VALNKGKRTSQKADELIVYDKKQKRREVANRIKRTFTHTAQPNAKGIQQQQESKGGKKVIAVAVAGNDEND